MTCIVGIEHEGRVWMGCDSQITSGGGRAISAHSKIFNRNGWLIGGSGLGRTITVVGLSTKLGKPKRGKSIYEYLNSDVASLIYTDLRDLSLIKTDNNIAEAAIWALFAYGPELYAMDSALHFNRVTNGYQATGSGGELALGVLFATDSGGDPESRIKMALNAACRHDTGCSPPFHIFHT